MRFVRNMTSSERRLGFDDSALTAFDEVLCPKIRGTVAAVKALHSLRNSALASGFDLIPCSGWRSFERQAAIIDAKWNGLRPVLDADEHHISLDGLSPEEKLQAILRFSALPGFSRHHFGTDFDIYAANLLPKGQKLELTAREYADGMYFHEFGIWLEANLERHGFIRPFTGFGRCAPEPWHISYISEAECFIAGFDLEAGIEALKKLNFPWSEVACAYARGHFTELFS